MNPQRVPFIPENAPFTPEQRSWLNGYFAGLFSRADAAAMEAVSAPAPQPAAKPLTILFGSQTGTAEGVAREVAERAKDQGFDPRVIDMAGYELADLPKEARLLVVTSTYGDGEMPDNAQPLWEALSKADAPRLSHTHFSVLALGDSNYETFCSAGERFDRRLEELGGQRAHQRVNCDVDYEDAFAAWLDGVLPAMLALNGANGVNGVNGKHSPSITVSEVARPAPVAPAASKKNPFPATLLAKRVLTATSSSKETRHYELSLAGSGIEYRVGDALSVIPRNCPALVEDTLAALGLSGEESVRGAAGEAVALRTALTEDYDLRAPSKELIAAVAERTGNPDLAAHLAADAKGRLAEFLWGREVVDLLLAYPQARFSADEFVGLLKKLQPRAYSISSSPRLHPGEVHLTVTSVRYAAHGRPRKGVCSTFLADRVDGELKVPVFLTPNKHFGVPADDQAPMVMVGPGTGIAPFRAFLEERKARGAKGRNWLFFGERNAASDFFYRDELEAQLRDGVLSRLDLAFSRDGEKKVYVQQRMLEQSRELYAWLQEGGYFFVCGDAQHMAKDVDAALHQVICREGGLTAEQAQDYINRLKKEKRYVRDVY